MEKFSYTYIMSNKMNGTLYVGVTSNLIQRVWQHKNGVLSGFTKRYGLKQLVYYEQYYDITEAIHREKQLKKWSRALKLNLIHQNNPKWEDLYQEICQ